MRILKEFGKAFFVGALVFIILGLIQYANGYQYDNWRDILFAFLYNQLYSVILYMVNAYYFVFLLKLFPNQVFQTKNLLKGLLGGILVTLLALLFIRFITEVIIDGKGFSAFIAAEKMQYYYISFIISVVVTTVFYVVYYYRNKQQTIVKEQKIIAGTASAKFDALKNQLDPHFLFNSL
ncbi:MAG TPA: histidine kinase, partial [Aequorivita sp.]|nr:histidine kinase [Aequorivita sp.]